MTDVLGDGLREVGTFNPTLAVSSTASPSSGNIAGRELLVTFSGGTGETTGVFNVSDELVRVL